MTCDGKPAPLTPRDVRARCERAPACPASDVADEATEFHEQGDEQ
jgi:hypothetical protein